MSAGMSRLDRLVQLLETGSTEVVRDTAGRQLADVQKTHPDELYGLLGRVGPYLRSGKWETRTAAAVALGRIVEQVPCWIGEGVDDDTNSATPKGVPGQQSDYLSLSTFDISAVLRHGRKLVGSAGKEYQVQMEDLSPDERLLHQKKSLKARLGLGGEFMEEDDLVSAADFCPKTEPHSDPPIPSSSPVEPPIALPTQVQGLSARQRNMMKRKAKHIARSGPSKLSKQDSAPSPVKKEHSPSFPYPSQDYFSVTPQSNSNRIVVEHKPQQHLQPLLAQKQNGNHWPFQNLLDLLLVDLFDPKWEIRHGAALGLRQLVKKHGNGGGRIRGYSKSQNDVLNSLWKGDLVCRLCCIFALDRFGDYISDTVVAPIRESAAQALAALFTHLDIESIRLTYNILSTLTFQNDSPSKIWEASHGGLLGLKYLVAVRRDIVLADDDLLDGIIKAVISGLAHGDDDVRSVSAATLVPVADEFVSQRPEAVDGLMDVIWSCLAEIKDDLSASTGTVMDLLAKLCSFPQVLDPMRQKANLDQKYSFRSRIPRLYPFLRHTITSVRLAVLKALLTFIDMPGDAWIDGKIFRLVFQNILLETNEAVSQLSLQVWSALIHSCNQQHFAQELMSQIGPMFSLLLTQISGPRTLEPLDQTLLLRPTGQVYQVSKQIRSQTPPLEPPKKRRRNTKVDFISPPTHNIDTPMIQGDIELVGLESVLWARISSAVALGRALATFPERETSQVYESLLQNGLVSNHTSSRLFATVVVQEYARQKSSQSAFKDKLTSCLWDSLTSPPQLSSHALVAQMKAVQAQCLSLNKVFAEVGRIAPGKIHQVPVVVQGEEEAGPTAFTIEFADKFVEEYFDRMKRSLLSQNRLNSSKALKDARTAVVEQLELAKNIRDTEHVRVMSATASAFVAMSQLPKKLNPVIRSIMESIKTEDIEFLQYRSALAVADLIELCPTFGNAVDKVIKNLCRFLCVDTSECPEFLRNESLLDIILSLKRDEERGPKDIQSREAEVKAARIKRRGAQFALAELCTRFGDLLLIKVPKLYECMLQPLVSNFCEPLGAQSFEPEVGQDIIDSLAILRSLIPQIHQNLHQQIVDVFPHILRALESRFAVIRYAAARAFAVICKYIPIKGLSVVIETILPMLNDIDNVKRRQGAIEFIFYLVQVMDIDILPFVIFLIIPVLGRMSDSDSDVRIVATTSFAILVKLVPLEAGIPDPPGVSKELLQGRDEERKFIAQMLDGSKVDPFEIPVSIKADLRKYQQEGVNWLAFLNKYKLHGILCDDMGLGKTLQTICIVASDHYNRAQQFEKIGALEHRPLPSLVICPPTLAGHWQFEVKTYAPFLKAVVYSGNPNERKRIRSILTLHDLVITTYDICRNDIDELCKQNWNYCVLDEGHVIKNARTKLTLAVKRLLAEHRLILSGTPIQNNVLELWSLFDFLMPGFLGSEKVFQERFAKPIAASRDSKSSSKEQEAGALALEALHKQVLPFLLRRLKEDVLSDLPPKIIQDYYCELSEIQKDLYQDFAKSQVSEKLGEQLDSDAKPAKTHVFQALQYMRKLCNHPQLVLKPNHPKYQQIHAQLDAIGSNIRDLQHAPKFRALHELLLDCGIGVQSVDDHSESAALAAAVNQHRALIFCQQKEMLDMIEKDVLKSLMPSVSYMRLDGGVDARKRHEIVQMFNADPSIDLLLLTTHVGGLGLNLTGADTVIFVEHDWNPMKDLQAMDRAHRLGQKKVVNVYRLVTRGTLEEKIMGLQRFKLNIASTVVSQQNAGLSTMDTGQILDLFNLGETIQEDRDTARPLVDAEGNPIKKGTKNVFEDLGDLWDENQYNDFTANEFLNGK